MRAKKVGFSLWSDTLLNTNRVQKVRHTQAFYSSPSLFQKARYRFRLFKFTFLI